MKNRFISEVRDVCAAACLRTRRRLLFRWEGVVRDARHELRIETLAAISPQCGDEAEELNQEWFDVHIADCYKRQRLMRALQNQAQRLGADTPDLSDPKYGEELDYPGHFEGKVFTEAGVRRALEMLRPARKERADAIARWATLAIGFLGALTGLVVALK